MNNRNLVVMFSFFGLMQITGVSDFLLIPYWRDETPFVQCMVIVCNFDLLSPVEEWICFWVLVSYPVFRVLEFQGLLRCRKMCGTAVIMAT